MAGTIVVGSPTSVRVLTLAFDVSGVAMVHQPWSGLRALEVRISSSRS